VTPAQWGALAYVVSFLMVAVIAYGGLDWLLRALVDDEAMERLADRIFRL
jgi:hypothetical protein